MSHCEALQDEVCPRYRSKIRSPSLNRNLNHYCGKSKSEPRSVSRRKCTLPLPKQEGGGGEGADKITTSDWIVGNVNISWGK